MSKDEERSLMDSKQKVSVEPTGAPAVPNAVEPAQKPVAPPNVTDHIEAKATAPIVPNSIKDEEYPTDGLASVATGSVVDAGDEAAATNEPSKPDEPDHTYKAPEADEPAEPDVAAVFPPAELDDIAEAAKTDTVPAISGANPVTEESAGPATQPVGQQTSGVVFEDAPTNQPAKPDPNAEPLPVLNEEDPMREMIVSHHDGKSRAGVVWVILALLLLGVIVFDVLLDAGIFVIDGIPHTDFF